MQLPTIHLSELLWPGRLRIFTNILLFHLLPLVGFLHVWLKLQLSIVSIIKPQRTTDTPRYINTLGTTNQLQHTKICKHNILMFPGNARYLCDNQKWPQLNKTGRITVQITRHQHTNILLRCTVRRRCVQLVCST